jgi:hypothetical protein
MGLRSAISEQKMEKTVMPVTNYKQRSTIATSKWVPTCTKCGDTEFTHQDKEFGGTMTRIIFCSNCGASIGVTIAI